MKNIETGLQNLHSQARETAMECDTSTQTNSASESIGEPFARIMAVVDGSPADVAGIKQGKKLLFTLHYYFEY